MTVEMARSRFHPPLGLIVEAGQDLYEALKAVEGIYDAVQKVWFCPICSVEAYVKDEIQHVHTCQIGNALKKAEGHG